MPISEGLGLDLGPFWAYFGGSGPDLGSFRPILEGLGLDLGPFWAHFGGSGPDLG